MPRKSNARPRTRKTLKGKGFMDFLSGVGNFLKDTKLLSTGLSLIPHPAGRIAGGVAGALGLGRKRKAKRKPQSGGRMVLPGVRSGTNQLNL
jgi:hypothetical protein